MANENNNPKVTIDGITITVNQEEYDYLSYMVYLVKQGVDNHMGMFTDNLDSYCAHLLKNYNK